MKKVISTEQLAEIVKILAELPAKNVYGLIKMIEALPECNEKCEKSE